MEERCKKIFIRRRSQKNRLIVNEEEVLQVFLSYQFEIVSFEDLSFEDQISLMSKVCVLAGVHGAGLTNMLFMPLNSVVFELTTKIDGENYYYYALSNDYLTSIIIRYANRSRGCDTRGKLPCR